MTLIFLGFLGGLIHFANVEVRSFERGAAAQLASRLQNDDKLVEVRANVGPEALWGDVNRVTIEGSKFTADGLPFFIEPKRSHVGVLRTLRIDLHDITLSGLHIHGLTATVPDCRFDFAAAVRHRQFHQTQSGNGTGEVVVSAQDLQAFLLKKYSAIKEATVTIDRDKIFVSGVAAFLFSKSSFTVIARLETSDGIHINLAHPRMILADKVVDEKTRDLIIGRLNPVLDLDRDLHLHGAITIQSLEARDGLLTGRGIVHLPDLPSD